MLVQQGARRNYVYAQQLEAAGLLHSLVTDAAWSDTGASTWTPWLQSLMPRLSGPMRRRTVSGVSASRLRASILPNLATLFKAVLHEERAYPVIDAALGLPARLRGIKGADIVVNYQGNGGPLLEYAKSKGASIVTDFVVTPKYLEIEKAERTRWPGWESDKTSPSDIAFYRRRMSHLVALSDLYLCPSLAVARDLEDLDGFDPARVRIVPYGLSGVELQSGSPVIGRVLFAGAAGLRKGIPYLAEAARILKDRGSDVEIVVAGYVSDAVRSRPEVADLTFLGMLDRSAMAREFAKADVYCLPSLAEGSATSVFEALANSLPVVTTLASGSVVEHGEEGFIVPERDGVAIANALQQIVSDRALRDTMSAAASRAALLYSDVNCGRTFIDVISTLAQSRRATREAIHGS